MVEEMPVLVSVLVRNG